MRLVLRYKGGPGSGFKGHIGRPGRIGGSSSGEVWYTSTRTVELSYPDLSREVGGAAGVGMYMTTTPDEASSWHENVHKIRVRGNILRGFADDKFIANVESIIGTDRFSHMVMNGDRPPAYALYDRLRTKFGDKRAAEYMIEFGYIGVEHASPRLGYKRQPNLVVFDPRAVEKI